MWISAGLPKTAKGKEQWGMGGSPPCRIRPQSYGSQRLGLNVYQNPRKLGGGERTKLNGLPKTPKGDWQRYRGAESTKNPERRLAAIPRSGVYQKTRKPNRLYGRRKSTRLDIYSM
jgi:hypothetical protein